MGAVQHGLAARFADVDDFISAQSTYQQAITHWQAWQQKYPADVSATQALAVIYAELAELHRSPSSSVGHINQEPMVCEYYHLSRDNLQKLPRPNADFPNRYSWSPSTRQIYERFQHYCQS